MKNSISHYLYLAMKVLLGCILLALLIQDRSFWNLLFVNGAKKGYFLPFLWGFIPIVAAYCICFRKLRTMRNYRWVGVFLFFLAMLPRLIVFSLRYYVPTNDFGNYLLFGQYVFYRNASPIADMIGAYYQMPQMGGLALINGLLAHLFSPTLVGLQIANMITTSMISVMIFLIIRKEHADIALIAALLFAIYPSNVVSTQITTNHHLATLLFLVAIHLFKTGLDRLRAAGGKPAYLLVGASCIFLVLSNYMHSSVIIVILSIVFYGGLIMLDQWKAEKKLLCAVNLRTLCALLIIVIGFPLVSRIGIQVFYRLGVVNETSGGPLLGKVVVGLNQETRGANNGDNHDYQTIREIPPEQQNQECIRMIRERLSDPLAVLRLFNEKSKVAWIGIDSYFSWYSQGAMRHYDGLEESGLSDREIAGLEEQKERQVMVLSGAQHLDMLFVQWIYLFAIAGMALRRRTTSWEVSNIGLFITLGWIFFIMLTEVQARYRYPAMPAFLILAAAGIYESYHWAKKLAGRKSSHSENGLE